MYASSDFRQFEVNVSNRTPQKLETLKSLFPILPVSDNRTCAGSADILVLAVKPQQMKDVIAEIRDCVNPQTIVISLAAALSLKQIESWFEHPVKLIRFMPNLGVAVGQGSLAVCCARTVSASDLDEVMSVFGPLGKFHVLPEPMIDSFIASSGSGIAFVFALIKAFSDTAARKGFTPEEARALTLETFSAALTLAQASDHSLSELIDQVCSKGGTTIEGIKVLNASNLTDILNQAFEATIARSKELSEILNRE